jgi:hypothetical protein
MSAYPIEMRSISVELSYIILYEVVLGFVRLG